MSDSRRLDTDAIVTTAEKLRDRIDDRFAGRGIARLSSDLVEVAAETRLRTADLRRPRWAVRWAITGVVAIAAVLLILSASQVRSGPDLDGVEDLLGVLENGLQDVVFLGLGLVFLGGLENRMKRRPALAGLHELRSIAHVIDMHQLTKDPDAILSPGRRTEHSPDRISDRYELARYLEYCSEMLSLANKLAALYAQDTQDPVVLGAVRDVQDLVGMLSAKIWQKLVILDTTRG